MADHLYHRGASAGHWARAARPTSADGTGARAQDAGDDVIYGDRYTLGRPPEWTRDVIVGVDIDDVIDAGAGNDSVEGGYGFNQIHGGAGNDVLNVGGQSAIYRSGYPITFAVVDYLNSNAAIPWGRLYGDDGDDQLSGGAKADVLDGGAGADIIYAGAGDDLIYGSAGPDTIQAGDGYDTVRAGAGGVIALQAINSVELITSGGLQNVAIVGDGTSQYWDFSSVTLVGIDHIAGGGVSTGPGGDFIVGSAGNDEIWAWGGSANGFAGDWIDGGAGDDVIRLMPSAGKGANLRGGTGADYFDLTLGGTEPLTNGSATGAVWVTGRETSSPTDDEYEDTVLLPGSPDDYDFHARVSAPEPSPLYEVTGHDTDLSPILFLRDIQKLLFTGQLANEVNVAGGPVDGRSDDLNLILEQIRLIDESYGWQQPLKHGAEDMVFVSSWDTDAAVSRGWHRLSPLELQFAATATVDDVTYVMNWGEYRATTPNPFPIPGIDDVPQGIATVLAGIVNGKRTVAITFRGTDQIADMVDYLDFADHYRKFAPLIAAIDAYVADPANGIEQVLVSGHSLGGAMVQEFMAEHQSGPDGVSYRALTIGSPGSDNPDRLADDPRIINFGHTGDAVFAIGSGHTDDVLKAAATMLAFAGAPLGAAAGLATLLAHVQDKHRQGASLVINDSLLTIPLLGEHSIDLYADSLGIVLNYAYDAVSPFSKHPFAAALRDNKPYAGDDLHIALVNAGTTTAITYGSDRYVLGSATDDTIYVVTRSGQSIDAGEGDHDRIIVFDPLGGLTWQRSGDHVTVWDGSQLALDLTRVEAMVRLPFGSETGLGGQAGGSPPALVTYFDGRSPIVQTLDAGNTTLTLRSDIDYALTGKAVTVRGTEGNDLIVVDGVTRWQNIYTGSGDDLVLVNAGAIAAGGAVHIGDYGGNDTFVNAGTSAGEFVLDAGWRTGWAVTLDDGGNVTLSRLTLDGIQTLRLVGDILIQYSDEATAFRPTQSFAPVFGTDSDNVLEAGNQASYVEGGLGDDTLIGSGFNDTLVGDSGADRLYGGPGDDLYSIDAEDLVFEQPGEGVDTVYTNESLYMAENIECLNIVGGDPQGVYAVGNAQDNVMRASWSLKVLLLGGSGDDSLYANEKNDQLFGESGDDALYGLGGIDYLAGGAGSDMLDGGNEADALYGEDGNDTLWGGTDFKTDVLVGGAGNDMLRGDSGQADYDLMDGGAGNDAYYVDTGDDLTFEASGGGTDTVYANVAGANNGVYLYANVENLVLVNTTKFGVGNELANTMTGSASGNWLLGGAGNDKLNGKAGGDVLFGEAGADTFIFEHGAGGDVIGDFAAGTDKIDLSAFGLTWQAIQNSMHEVNGTTAIDLGGGDFIVLNGVARAALHEGDFILTGESSAVVALEPKISDQPDGLHNWRDGLIHVFDDPYARYLLAA